MCITCAINSTSMPRVVSEATAHLFNNKTYNAECIMHLLTAQDKILIGCTTAFTSKRSVYKRLRGSVYSSSRDNSDNIVLRKSTWECEDRMSSHRPTRSLHPLLFPPLATREQNSRVNVGDNEPCVLLRVECLCWPFVLLNITKQLSYLFSLITRGYRGNTQGLMNFKIHGEKWPPRANTE